MRNRIWVAQLQISRRTAHKLATVHSLQAEDVRAQVQCVAGLTFSWDDDPERGLRAIVRVQIHGQPHLVVLYPADDPLGDVWNLGSAYPIK